MKPKTIFWIVVMAALLLGCASPSATTTEEAAPPATATATATAPLPTQTPLALVAGEEAILDVSLDDAIPLEGKWRFQHVDRFDPSMTTPEFDDSLWAEVNAPATWEAQGLDNLVATGAVVVYRYQVKVPKEWQGKEIGISACFNPYYGSTFVNGQAAPPLRKPFAPYAEVSKLLKYGEMNTIAVTTQYDGYLQFTGSGPARLGPIIERAVIKVIHDDIKIPGLGGEIEATLIRPQAGEQLPGLVLYATGSHGMAERDPWFDLADDLARQGFVSLVVVLSQQTSEGILAGVNYLRSLQSIDPDKIAIFGVDQATEALVNAAVADQEISGVILLSPAPAKSVAELGSRPLLLMASKDDRRGMALKQVQELADLSSGPSTMVTLPGDGRGTFVFTAAWNQVRSGLLDWLSMYQFIP